MRKKMILIIILLFITIVALFIEMKNEVFVKESKVNIIVDDQIQTSQDLLYNLNVNNYNDNIPGVNNKFIKVEKTDTHLCGLENATLISNEGKSNIIAVDRDNNFEYYKETNGVCDLIGKVENVNFVTNSIDAFANNSIYTSFDSINDFEMSGLIRVTNDEIIPFDTIEKRFSNPRSFSNGVLLIENNRNIRAFDDKNKVIFSQVNENTNRQILAINAIDNSLFVIVQKNNEIFIEGYNLKKTSQLKNKKPSISINITDKIDFMNSDIYVKRNENFASFSSGNSVIIVAKDFSSLFLLNNADTVVGIDLSSAVIKDEELFYILDLNNKLREDIGKIKALSFKANRKDIFFSVLDSKNNEQYIKFTIK